MTDSALYKDGVQGLVATMKTYQRSEGFTDQAMADKLGIPRPTWTAMKNGKFRPSLEFVQKIAIEQPEFRIQAKGILLAPTNGGR